MCLQVSWFLALSFHSFKPIFLRSLDMSSSHFIFGLPLRLVAYSFPYNIFFGIAVSCILSMWPSHRILWHIRNLTMFSPLIMASNSSFRRILHNSFSFTGPYIFRKIFLPNTANALSSSMLSVHDNINRLPLTKFDKKNVWWNKFNHWPKWAWGPASWFVCCSKQRPLSLPWSERSLGVHRSYGRSHPCAFKSDTFVLMYDGCSGLTDDLCTGFLYVWWRSIEWNCESVSAWCSVCVSRCFHCSVN